MDPALLRAVLTELAERAAGGRRVRVDRRRAGEILRLAAEPEGGTVELAGAVRAICEAGTVRFASALEATPEPVRLPIPGQARFGDWELSAEIRVGAVEPRGPELATLDADALGGEVEIRAWREGDRIRPLGLEGGSKSLQDLFTDSRVPRSLRRRLPVVVAGERIAWVAGLAVSEEFRLGPLSRSSAVITARAAAGAGPRSSADPSPPGDPGATG